MEKLHFTVPEICKRISPQATAPMVLAQVWRKTAKPFTVLVDKLRFMVDRQLHRYRSLKDQSDIANSSTAIFPAVTSSIDTISPFAVNSLPFYWEVPSSVTPADHLPTFFP